MKAVPVTEPGPIGSSTGQIVSVLHQCPADFDGNHEVNTADLIALLGAWGCGNGISDCREEIDQVELDTVGFGDLLELISNWGTCPGTH